MTLHEPFTKQQAFDLRIFLWQVKINPRINRDRWAGVYGPALVTAAILAGLVDADAVGALTITDKGKERVS